MRVATDWGEGGTVGNRLPLVSQAFVETVSRRFESLEGKIGDMRDQFIEVGGRLDNVESRLDKVEIRLDKVDTRLDKVEKQLDRVEVRLDATATRADLESIRTELYQAISAQTWRMITAAAALVAATYYIARYVH